MTPSTPAPEPPPRSLWHHAGFMKLWTGQTISEFGSRITREGLPLAAVINLSATPTQMGLLAAVASAPVLVFGLFAGVWVDRLRRRPIMIAADFGRAFVLLVIPLAAVLGVLRLDLILVVIALAGTLSIFFDTAYRTYLPTLVERAEIVEGNSKLALSDSMAEVLGPGISGVLVQALTAPIAILFDALSFLVSALTVALIRAPEPPPPPVAGRRPVLHEITEGLRAVAAHPLLRTLALAAATLSFFGNFFAGLYGLYSIRVLGMGPALLGLTVAVGGIGSLLGSLFAERAVRRLGLGPMFVVMLVVMGVSGLFIPLAGGPLWQATLFMSLAQLGDAARTVYIIGEESLRQSVTPQHLLGRVNASSQLLVAGVGPLGAILGGVLADTIGVRETLFVAALGPFIGCLWILFSPLRGLKSAAVELM
jgi:predicted MFS family arabinose efflux permease